jgi:DNA-binding Lrp family transcriptional regulator
MYYIVITHTVYANNDLTASCKITYGLILSLSQKDGYCYAENAYIAETLNISVRTVQYHLTELQKHRLIVVRHTKSGVRRITTIDTRVNIKQSTKKPVALKKQVKNATEPDWMDEYLTELAQMEG